MEVALYSFNGVAPVFIVIFLGMLLQKLKFFSEETKQELTKLVFYVGTPALLFSNVASSNLYESFNSQFIIFIIAATLVFTVLSILLCFYIKDKSKKAAVVQLAFRSNFAIVGIPLAKQLLDAAGVAETAVLMSFVVITYNVLAVIVLSYYTGRERKFMPVLISIIKNPLIIGILAGLVFSVLRIPLPQFLNSAVGMVGNIATSIGLIILGATISLSGFQKNGFYIMYAVFLRNILAPVLFLFTAVLLGFRGNQLIITAIVSAAPSAVNCFVMAKKMGADADISAFGISFSSLFSVISIFISVYLIKILGF